MRLFSPVATNDLLIFDSLLPAPCSPKFREKINDLAAGNPFLVGDIEATMSVYRGNSVGLTKLYFRLMLGDFDGGGGGSANAAPPTKTATTTKGRREER